MRFPADFIEEIKQRVVLSDLIGREVRLKREGRQLVGLCPMHSERTPSFYVDDARGSYRCFGCGSSGDSIGWIMQRQGLKFGEAVEYLAQYVGLPLPNESVEAKHADAQRRALRAVMAKAAKFYQGQLGEAQRAYLKARGVSSEAIERFGIGYATKGPLAVYWELREQGQGGSLADMVAADLVVLDDKGKPLFDRFRERIMFPIADRSGNVIAFSGRTTRQDMPAKYINSRETPIFSKGSVLYNFHRAQERARAGAPLVIVEGQMDVIAADSAGLAAVAALGTALTSRQLEHTWRLNNAPVVLYDGDPPGRKATRRAATTALPFLKSDRLLKFGALSDGMDPADCILQSGGISTLIEAVDRAEPYFEYLWHQTIADRSLKSPEQAAAIEHELTDAISNIPDRTLAEQYRKALRERIAPRMARNGHRAPLVDHLVNGYHRDEMSLHEALTLAAAWTYPEEAISRAEEISADERIGPTVMAAISDLINHNPHHAGDFVALGNPAAIPLIEKARRLVESVGLDPATVWRR